MRASIAPLPGGDTIEVDGRTTTWSSWPTPGCSTGCSPTSCENALKYTPDSARVRVDADAAPGPRRAADRRHRARACHDDDRERIFAPFQRLGDVPQRDGVGLGLAVARGLTEAMGGTIATEETPGGGLTFVLELPAADRPPTRGARMTFVLVVDDDPAMRRTLTINLRARDYEVETPATAGPRCRSSTSGCPTSSCSTSGSPTSTASRCCAQLRAFSQVPGRSWCPRGTESDDKVEALDLGADDYITKPFAIEELLARVRAASRRAAREEPDLVVEVDGLRLDVTDSRATRDGEEIHLTPTEWRIVEVLARRRGRLVRQAELLSAVWGPAYETRDQLPARPHGQHPAQARGRPRPAGAVPHRAGDRLPASPRADRHERYGCATTPF